MQRMTWIFLLLACSGASWFSYQCFLEPQPAHFIPDWQGAQWIQAGDGQAPVAYFRYVTNLGAIPDATFVTVAANQIFRLYINGTFLASNELDFMHDSSPQAYIYDINALLRSGTNVIALRVTNADKQLPCVRVSLGKVVGKSIYYNVSGMAWQATAVSTLVYLRYAKNQNAWTQTDFQSSAWPSAHLENNQTLAPLLPVDPLLYERPVASHWVSIGVGRDAYFVHNFSSSIAIKDAWLRIAAVGNASIFINGHLLIVWNGEAPPPKKYITTGPDEPNISVQYQNGLAMGIYNVTPYLHSGINVLAVHVSSPGASAALVGLDSLHAALSLDMLIRDGAHTIWLTPDASWHTSSQAVPDWTNDASLKWSSPIDVGRPGVINTFYLPASDTQRNTHVFPYAQLGIVVLLTCSTIIGCWLFLALILLRCYYPCNKTALETLSIAYLPALACEALLMVCSRETQIPQPFPYTYFWGEVLIILTVASYILLWLNARTTQQQSHVTPYYAPAPSSFRPRSRPSPFRHRIRIYPYIPQWIITWFYLHWTVVLFMLIALPLACYNLSYEPHWQDELSSYYAAQGILTHGLPFFPSGFLYEKAELYSYALALWSILFGDAGTRFISALEYVASIPLLYFVGCYFFKQRIALLAAAMLTFSPTALLWGRQIRMYEQAQFLTLLVMYLFCRAVQEHYRIRLVYIAIVCLVLDYLSHEEVFIILPALLICSLLSSRKVRYWLPAVFYQRQWWYAFMLGSLCIITQLLLTKITHPPLIGTDSSQRPLIQLSTNNIPFYVDLLFVPSALAKGTLPWITLNSILALIGCIWTRYDSNRRARYCALFLSISFFTLTLMFTMQAERYFYPLLPIYFLMASYALIQIFNRTHMFACSHLVLPRPAWRARRVRGGYLSWQMDGICKLSMAAICIGIVLAPMLPISNYSLLISRLAGLSYHRHYPDYDVTGQYVKQHWHKGDIVIAIAPDFSVFYYVGHVDYFFSIDRALYLFERNGHIVDTSLGITALFNQSDFNSVLVAHARIWIISDNAVYQAQAAKRFVFPPDFHIVSEGYQSVVYFRG